ncbi:cation:proton antiporter [Oscillochloris sp. ZM17-4]|uniref:cation:proton antiporter domain-containing protein n=1 Tax=Oscillochloris sp. ZM17-4 TaxID=2866714 RepID=UPI001C72D388|nr:cation:proton antiporter [Oscillochloris sp. ZM17-4]MBX0331095.1 cation:proton antiporter [Oscillochloris sp. ZM17-4]
MHEVSVGVTLLSISVVLIVAKLSTFIERYGQPPVLGELLAGVVLGNMHLLGIHIFEPIRENGIIQFLAELGVVILLFQVGLVLGTGLTPVAIDPRRPPRTDMVLWS